MASKKEPLRPDGDKTPRTPRGQRTLDALIDAAGAEFGEKGFHDAAISRITSRAGVALGTFYTYFDSKEEVFRALVDHMSAQVRDHVRRDAAASGDRLSGEGAALESFLRFVRTHKEIYRIIDEAEFVANDSYKRHYSSTVERVLARLRSGAERGEVRADISEVEAWAIVGMNVFLGLRYGVWSEEEDAGRIAGVANRLLREGLAPA